MEITVYEVAAAKAQAAKAKAQAAAEAKALWIETHGSAHLRRASLHGYNCQRRYVTERAALELPGYELDFDDRAEWKSRTCPTEEALDEVDRLKELGHTASVVWLSEADDLDEGDEREAIVVSGYLGKYTLLRY